MSRPVPHILIEGGQPPNADGAPGVLLGIPWIRLVAAPLPATPTAPDGLARNDRAA